MYYTYSFEKLDVYKLSKKIQSRNLNIDSNFPKDERFELISQIRRSSSSIATNLAEGSGRASLKDQAYFTNISFASALETIDHLSYSLDIKYIDEVQYEFLRINLDEIINKLNALYKYQINSTQDLKS